MVGCGGVRHSSMAWFGWVRQSAAGQSMVVFGEVSQGTVR